MSALAAGFAGLVALLLYPSFVQGLRRLGAGQRIRPEGPASHLAKAGTPTAGGLLFVVVVLVAWVLPGRSDAALPSLVALTLGAALGIVDDYRNVRGQRSLGLPAGMKFTLQWGMGLLALVPLTLFANPQLQLIPLFGMVDLGVLWAPLAWFAFVASANAVNLTDGSDGLAGSVTLTVLAALAVILGLSAAGVGVLGTVPPAEPGLLLWSVVGLFAALAAFLVFNVHPARVIMGDTGAMALGFYVAALAVQLHVLLVLPLLGLVYVLETLSVVVQVAWFKRTGRRVLRMSPLHHHLQLGGWQERGLALWLSLLNVVGALAGLALALATPERR
ncbi:MAG: phospho-N-acetylmuramoyl-pentapeptide-transferase [Candidatus Dormibacteria bacterium]